ncbi:MAG: carbon storage regulator CsrA [Actinomycetota bacterium]
MLVLTRRAGESIMIGSEIVVTVLESRGDQVRIGIEAPRRVQIHRAEVYREIERENAAAIASADRASALLGKRQPDLKRDPQSRPSNSAGEGPGEDEA